MQEQEWGSVESMMMVEH